MPTRQKEVKRYVIKPKELGNEAYVTNQEDFYYLTAVNLLRGCVSWTKDFSAARGGSFINYGNEDLEREVDYLHGSDIVFHDGYYTVKTDDKEYGVALCKDFLRIVTQDQVDSTLYSYGLFRTRRETQMYTPANTIIIWKDDFFRVGNVNDIDKRQMLCLYLGIYTEDDLGDGVGMVDGYAIADFNTFKRVASPEQITKVTADIAKRNGSPTVSQLWRDREKERKNR